MNKSEAGKLGYEKVKEKLAKKSLKNKQTAIDKYIKQNKHCPTCNEKIPYEKRSNKFCSHKCAAIFNNIKRVRGYTGKIKYEKCSICPNQPSRKNKFCDDCISKNKHAIRNLNLEDCKTDATRKRFLLREQDHICEICQNTMWNGKPIPLELDHIDGYHMNNSKINLRLICPNCHAQTSTYKAKNKGNGRKHRRTGHP